MYQRYSLETDKWNNTKRYIKTQRLLRRLKQRPCKDCGIRYHFCQMSFDHVVGVKKFNMSSANKRNLEEIMLEAAKCEIVCANCHAMRTYQRYKNHNQ